MEKIILFSGKVKYPITLDPGVWIFDDRRVDLTTYFNKEEEKKDELEEYTKEISKHWDREIMEGAIFPPTLKTEKKFEKEKVLTGTFGIPFKPFLKNAEPESHASTVIIVCEPFYRYLSRSHRRANRRCRKRVTGRRRRSHCSQRGF